MLGTIVLLTGLSLAQVEAPAAPEASKGPSAASPAGDAARVEALVARLGAEKLAARQAAEEELVRLGPRILPLLRPRAKDNVSLERIVKRLERIEAISAAEAATVTLHVRDAPVSKVLAALEAQTGNRFSGVPAAPGAAEMSVSVDFDNVPFWKALDEVLEKANLAFYAFSADRSIRIEPRAQPAAPLAGRVSYSGPFRIEAVAVESRRDLRHAADGGLKVRLEVAWEPRVGLIALKAPMAEVRGADESGGPIPADQPAAVLEALVSPQVIAAPLAVSLALPPRSVRQIAKLEGRLEALVPGKVETFRFENLAEAKNAQQRRAGVTVTLQQARRSGELWEMWLVVRYEQTHGALASHRTWIFANPAALVGADGKRLPYETYQTTRQTENELGVVYSFRAAGPIGQYALEYQTPGLILKTTPAYDFQGIPLP